MKRLAIAVALAGIVSAVTTAVAVAWYLGRDVPGDGVVVASIDSATLAERRELLVRLPENYESSAAQRYPVVYVLDGSSEDVHAARSAALLARLGLMPGLIVVGLPNVSGEGRQRDYTPPFMAQDIDEAGGPAGQGDTFIDFLAREVVPWVESRYRTSRCRMLAGHSRGGLLVAYSLMYQPDLFAARFAHSPALWREDRLFIRRLEEHLASTPAATASTFYLSMGSREVPQMMSGFEAMRAVLERRASPWLRWRADVVAGADHQQNGEWATPIGFAWLYGVTRADDTGARRSPALLAPCGAEDPLLQPSRQPDGVHDRDGGKADGNR